MHYRHGRKEQPAACRLEKTPGGCDLIKIQVVVVGGGGGVPTTVSATCVSPRAFRIISVWPMPSALCRQLNANCRVCRTVITGICTSCPSAQWKQRKSVCRGEGALPRATGGCRCAMTCAMGAKGAQRSSERASLCPHSACCMGACCAYSCTASHGLVCTCAYPLSARLSGQTTHCLAAREFEQHTQCPRRRKAPPNHGVCPRRP